MVVLDEGNFRKYLITKAVYNDKDETFLNDYRVCRREQISGMVTHLTQVLPCVTFI